MNKGRCILLLLTLIVIISCTKSDKKDSKEPEYSVFELNEMVIKALDEKDYEVAEEILDKGADPNLVYQNRSLLYICSKYTLTRLGLKAIDKGADVNWISDEKITPLSFCITKDNLELGKAIIENNLDYTYKDEHRHNYFAICLFEEKYDFVDLLLSNSAIYDTIKNDYMNFYPLIYYWTSKTPELITRIYGENFTVPDEVPVLLISIGMRNYDAVKYFIDKGVDKNKEYYFEDDEEYVTPLSRAKSLKFRLTHYLGSDTRYTEEDDVVKTVNAIIQLLEE